MDTGRAAATRCVRGGDTARPCARAPPVRSARRRAPCAPVAAGPLGRVHRRVGAPRAAGQLVAVDRDGRAPDRHGEVVDDGRAPPGRRPRRAAPRSAGGSARRRPPRRPGPSSPSRPRSSTTNSSPPNRPTRSSSRTSSRTAAATAASTWSPTRCPYRSLTCLKWSRSSTSTVACPSRALDAAQRPAGLLVPGRGVEQARSCRRCWRPPPAGAPARCGAARSAAAAPSTAYAGPERGHRARGERAHRRAWRTPAPRRRRGRAPAGTVAKLRFGPLSTITATTSAMFTSGVGHQGEQRPQQARRRCGTGSGPLRAPITAAAACTASTMVAVLNSTRWGGTPDAPPHAQVDVHVDDDAMTTRPAAPGSSAAAANVHTELRSMCGRLVGLAPHPLDARARPRC